MNNEIANVFEQELPAILERNAEAARAFNATYQMHILGAGSWHLDLSATGPHVRAGEHPADCIVTTSIEDFQRIRATPSIGLQLFMTGKMKVGGKSFLATKLQKLFNLK